ncbi:MAG: glutamyl-tRNA reductase, partial [Thermodesulfobacteriota bacterium]|nr:glutamyl-tRNA reductase [Thermodesulfobacteriota bacterium]
KEAAKAELIIADEVSQFQIWLSTLEVKPTVVALRQQLEQVRCAEVQKTLSSLSGLNDKERKAIESMTCAIVNKILHHPTHILKQANNNGDGSLYIDAVRTLFDLSDPVDQKPDKLSCSDI